MLGCADFRLHDLVNVTSTSSLSACSAVEIAMIREFEFRDPGPDEFWEVPGRVAKLTKKRKIDTADRIRIAAVESAPFTALCKASAFVILSVMRSGVALRTESGQIFF